VLVGIALLTAVVTNVSRAQVKNGVRCAQILRLAIHYRHQSDGGHLLLQLLIMVMMMRMLVRGVVIKWSSSLDFDAT
jgi:hypothetical protein